MEKYGRTGFSFALLMGVKIELKTSLASIKPSKVFIKTGRSPSVASGLEGTYNSFRKVKDMTSRASLDFLVHLLGKRVSLRW